MEEEEIKKAVREGYAKIAEEGVCGSTVSCCGGPDLYDEASKKMGYTEKELQSVPEGVNLALGCGNPVALASLREGETVLDLGSGTGLDCFLAAQKVGEKGRVIGVDMTPTMIDKARENARKTNHKNVEFRLGEIENLPVADNTADVVISNCVINLSPQKKRVFEEAFRVLKAGGRLMVSDVVLLKELPETVKKSNPAGCVAGAVMKHEYVEAIRSAGFQGVETIEETQTSIEEMMEDPLTKAAMEKSKRTVEEVGEILSSVASITVSGIKPLKR